MNISATIYEYLVLGEGQSETRQRKEIAQTRYTTAGALETNPHNCAL